MEWSSQLSVSKWGNIKVGATPTCINDLDPLTSIKAQAVLDLQLRWAMDHTIWLVGELIHVIRGDGYQTRAHWSETATLESHCAMNAKNLLQLADYIDEVAPTAFSMKDFARDKWDELLDLEVHECGTVCCAIGYGPAAGLPTSPDDVNDWHTYSERVFGLESEDRSWRWCFDAAWVRVDDTPTGAAKRIRHLVEHGLPSNPMEQLRGRAPYIFAEAA